MTERRRITRRDFLRHGLVGVSAAATFPAFLGVTARRLLASELEAGGPALRGGEILVVLQLAGGNDGLNTIVPYSNDDYHRARPTLGLDPRAVLRIDDHFGLHPALGNVRDLFERGIAAAVHGVGYPNPSRSHFRSTDVWHAGHPDRAARSGWIGRYFDNQCAGAHPALGVALHRNTPLLLESEARIGVAFSDPESLCRGADRLPEPAPSSARHASAGQDTLDFLERVESDARLAAESVHRALQSQCNSTRYPATALGRDLSIIARMIAADCPTRIFYLSHGGYDTHFAQARPHEVALRALDEGLAAFLRDLEHQGNVERVLVLTFSEFGRRVRENDCEGTDHGAAAPCLFFGGSVTAGLHGRAPSLAAPDLVDGDLRHTVDFRNVYATILERWLRAPSERILGARFETVDFLHPA